MVKIRQANEQDISKIKQVVTSAWYDTYAKFMSASTVAQFLDALYSDELLKKRLKESTFIVAEVDGQIVGFNNYINGKELFLAASYVHPDFQRRAIGSELLAEGIQMFSEYDAIYVEVSLDNKKAVQFYEKRNFELVRSYERSFYGEQVLTGLFKKSI